MIIKSLWRKAKAFRRLADKLLRFAEKFRLTPSIAPPQHLYMELASSCNLKCPLCPTGARILDRKYEFMKWETFKRVIDNVAPFRPGASFNMWGETLLHPKVAEFIRYAKGQGIPHIVINTNGNIRKPPKWFDELATSGLDNLLVDMDGADQATYEQYRVRGKLELVLDFLANVQAAKQRAGSSLPRVDVLIVINRFNQDQVEAIKERVEPLGVAGFLSRNVGVLGMPKEVETPSFIHFAQTLDTEANCQGITADGRLTFIPQTPQPLRLACQSLWGILHVNAQGEYVPCCKTYASSDSIGHIDTSLPMDFWFSKELTKFRKKNLDDPESIPVCSSCYFIRSVRGIAEETVRPFSHEDYRNAAE